MVQSSPGIKAKELAEWCEASERTIYRDIDIISAANLPITNEGHGKGYEFIGNFKLYPMDWDSNTCLFYYVACVIRQTVSHDWVSISL